MINQPTSNILSALLDIPIQPAWGILDSTKAKAYLSCPRKFMYEHVFGWRPEYPSNHLVFGSSLHLALEYLLLNGYEAKQVQEAYDLFIEDYRKTYGSETDMMFEPKTPTHAYYTLIEYAKTWQHDLDTYDVVYTEIGGSVSIGYERAIHFKMDSVLRNKATGRYISLDHKTASSFYGWSDQFHLSTQTGTYTHVLNCLVDPTLVDGVVYNGIQMAKSVKGWQNVVEGTNHKVKSPIDFMRVPATKTKAQMQTWLWTINNIYRQIEEDYTELVNHDPNAAVLKCFQMKETACHSWGRLCEYHDFCLAWQNPLQRIDQVPLGFKQEFWNPTEEPVKETFVL